MRKDPVIRGQPIHAMASAVPIGALVTSAALDAVWLVNREPMRQKAAEVSLLVAACSTFLASVSGVWDWREIAASHPAKATTTYHGWMHGLGAGILIASLAVHRQARPVAGSTLTFASLLATIIAAWAGWKAVFREGWRVRPAEWEEQIELQLRKDGSVEPIERAYEKVRAYERDHTLLPE